MRDDAGWLRMGISMLVEDGVEGKEEVKSSQPLDNERRT